MASIFSALAKAAKPVSKFIARNASTLLVISGTGLMVGTVVSAVVDAPKGFDTMDAARAELEMIENQDPAFVAPNDIRKQRFECISKTVLQQIKNFARTLVLGIMALGCFHGAHILDMKNIAALGNMYSASVNAHNEYRKHVEEKYGKQTDTAIRQEVAQRKFEEAEASGIGALHSIDIRGNRHPGDIPVHCLLTDIWFWSSKFKIRTGIERAEEYMNNQEYYLDASDFLDMLGMPYDTKALQILCDKGWNRDNLPRPELTPIWFGNDGIEMAAELDYSACMPFTDYDR